MYASKERNWLSCVFIHAEFHYLIPTDVSWLPDSCCCILSGLNNSQNVGTSSSATRMGCCWNGLVSLFGEYWTVGPEQDEYLCLHRLCNNELMLQRWCLQHHGLMQPPHLLLGGRHRSNGHSPSFSLVCFSALARCGGQWYRHAVSQEQQRWCE
jgi:hypothetical protein